jgi:nitrogen-specific signal transduction histidine kinase
MTPEAMEQAIIELILENAKLRERVDRLERYSDAGNRARLEETIKKVG